MAASASPVELPTNRNSFHQAVFTSGDPNDRHYIPILSSQATNNAQSEVLYDPSQEKELSPYGGSSFSPITTRTPNSPRIKPKPLSMHSYTKSSLAPEMLELDGMSTAPTAPLPPLPPMPRHSAGNFELPATRPTSRYYENNHGPTFSKDTTLSSADEEMATDASATVSNAGTASTASTVDDVLASTDPQPSPKDFPLPQSGTDSKSARSSFSSTKQLAVAPPTSKFNRKPATALASRVVSLQAQEAQSRPTSGRNTPVRSRSQTPQPEPSPKTSPEAQPEMPPLPHSHSATSIPHVSKPPSLKPSKSNASMASLNNADNVTLYSALPSSIQHTPRLPYHAPRKSTQSLKSIHTQYDRKDNSPLPPQPLPKVEAPKPEFVQTEIARSESPKVEPLRVESPKPAPDQNPPSVEVVEKLEKPEPARLASQPKLGPSSGIASFMTANDTVIFRRFDEVHVQLLLCLQDEITELERELMKLDSASMTRGERDINRNRVLQELRKVVAEYGKFHRIFPGC